MDERMACYLAMVEDRLKKLDEWIVRSVPRKENMKVNALAGIAATLFIKECATNEVNLGWMHDIVKYL
ncbi:hypothetical protein AAG906_025543 [Vitis piasezkii]